MNANFVTQRSIGKWFGVSSIRIGKILTAHGLKDREGATRKALVGGYAREAQTRDKITFFVWDGTKVCMIIDDALGDAETPYIDDLVEQVGRFLAEADRHSAEGNDFLADLVEDQALQGVPLGLVALIRARLAAARCAGA